MNWNGRIDREAPPLEQAAPRRRWAVVAIGVVVLLVVLLSIGRLVHKRSAPGSAGQSAAGSQGAGATLPMVTVTVPGRTQTAGTVSATGTLAARREMPVGVAGEGGMVRQVLVDAGDWVKAGQTLATIDRSVQVQQADQLSAQIRAAEANAALAQSDLERAQKLVGRGFISRADIDTKTAARDAARAQVQVARAELAQTQAQIGRLDIRSPAAGLVLTRGVEAGQVVSSASGALFRVAKDGEMEMMARVAEADLAHLRVGQSAKVTPVGSSTSVVGTIWQLAPVIDPTTRQGYARIALHYNPSLRPGGFASAEIDSGTVDAPELPQSAVLSDDKGNYVYIDGPGDTIERRNVTLGQVTDNGIAIRSGLAGNEKVIVSAGPFLNPGDKIKPSLVAARAALGG